MKSIKEFFLELVSIQSDTGTLIEKEAGKKIFSIISEDPYFMEHKDLCGMEETGDFLERPVVWALKRGKSDKTIILYGHYDAVEIDSYGSLREYALNPIMLKEKLQSFGISDKEVLKHLDDDDWMFGRGTADMKAGVAINMHILLSSCGSDVNILFTAVPDEENISAGCRSMMPLLSKLKRRFSLDYKVCLITEPQLVSDPTGKTFTIYAGGTGKILPIIIAKGKLAHCATNIEGLNSAHMIAEAVRDIDINPDLMSYDLGIYTSPPAVQIMKVLKNTYDVSLPEYSAACINVLFLGDKTPELIMRKIGEICEESFKRIIEKYNKVFDIAKAKKLVEETARLSLKADVISMKQLEERVREVKGDKYELFMNEVSHAITKQAESGQITLQDASCTYMKTLLENAQIDSPLFVIGMAPPYYPAVSNVYVNKETSCIENAIRSTVMSAMGMELNVMPYLPGMADISYMSCSDKDSQNRIMESLSVPKELYSIPFDDIAELNIPSYMIGPRCGGCHQLTERVYMPDVENYVPMIIQSVIKSI